MVSNVIKASFGNSRSCVTQKVYEYDENMKLLFVGLDLPTAYRVDFSNDATKGNAMQMIGDETGVLIPYDLFLTGLPIHAFLVLENEGNGMRTTHEVMIPIAARPKATDEEPTEAQQTVIDQAISALNAAVEQTAADVTAAAASASAAASSEANASASERAAAASATAASGSAATASTKASEAASSASTASSKANEASASATAAASSASSAASAAQNAASSEQSAQSHANDAEQAKTDAQDAQTAAEQAAQSVSGLSAQIAQNTSDIADLMQTKAGVLIDTASGSIASFVPDATVPTVKGLTVDIEPVQSGSGDPSPDNIRPISGWDSVDVHISPTQDAADGTTYTIQLGQTVYGGTVDAVQGVLTVDRAMVDLGTLNWISEESDASGQFRVSQVEIIPLNPKYSSVQCSILKGVAPKSYSSFNKGEIGLSNVSTAPILRARAEAFIGKTAEEIRAIMQDQQLVYELATPITIDLTPIEVAVLTGQTNNVWADCGDVSVEYAADLKTYIDQKIAAAVAALS